MIYNISILVIVSILNVISNAEISHKSAEKIMIKSGVLPYIMGGYHMATGLILSLIESFV